MAGSDFGLIDGLSVVRWTHVTLFCLFFVAVLGIIPNCDHACTLKCKEDAVYCRNLAVSNFSESPQRMCENCTGSDIVFDCLDSASVLCAVDQGSLTFQQLKVVIRNVSSRLDAFGFRNKTELNASCPSVSSCWVDVSEDLLRQLQNETGFKHMAYARYLVYQTRTGAYCSLFKNILRCDVERLEKCGKWTGNISAIKQEYSMLSDICSMPPFPGTDYGELFTESSASRCVLREVIYVLMVAMLMTWLLP